MQVGRAQRQGSRLGMMRSSRMQPVNTGQAQANGSSLEQGSPSQPCSPASTAPQVLSSPRLLCKHADCFQASACKMSLSLACHSSMFLYSFNVHRPYRGHPFHARRQRMQEGCACMARRSITFASSIAYINATLLQCKLGVTCDHTAVPGHLTCCLPACRLNPLLRWSCMPSLIITSRCQTSALLAPAGSATHTRCGSSRC
jgi:hypothetical protein